MAVLAADVVEQLQGIGVLRVDAGEHQVDPAALHQADRHPIVGRLFDLGAQRLDHRRQEGEVGRLGMHDQQSGLTHVRHSLVKTPAW